VNHRHLRRQVASRPYCPLLRTSWIRGKPTKQQLPDACFFLGAKDERNLSSPLQRREVHRVSQGTMKTLPMMMAAPM
jgi:hypothetical protein